MAGIIVEEWCPECKFWVEPYVQENVGFCPECHGTTKDLANHVQTGPNYEDAPETVKRWKLVRKYNVVPQGKDKGTKYGHVSRQGLRQIMDSRA